MLYTTIYRLLFENEDRYDLKIENDKLIYTEKIHIGPMTMMTITTYNIYDLLIDKIPDLTYEEVNDLKNKIKKINIEWNK
jgi:hypothetical protein